MNQAVPTWNKIKKYSRAARPLFLASKKCSGNSIGISSGWVSNFTWRGKTVDQKVYQSNALHWSITRVTSALWVRLNVKQEIGKFLPHPSFYPCPNISDRFPPQASHFIRIQIFQIYILEDEMSIFQFLLAIFMQKIHLWINSGRKGGRAELF